MNQGGREGGVEETSMPLPSLRPCMYFLPPALQSRECCTPPQPGLWRCPCILLLLAPRCLRKLAKLEGKMFVTQLSFHNLSLHHLCSLEEYRKIFFSFIFTLKLFPDNWMNQNLLTSSFINFPNIRMNWCLSVNYPSKRMNQRLLISHPSTKMNRYLFINYPNIRMIRC